MLGLEVCFPAPGGGGTVKYTVVARDHTLKFSRLWLRELSVAPFLFPLLKTSFAT
jgi:hypothetical protein